MSKESLMRLLPDCCLDSGMQAEKELGPDWTLMRAGTPGTPSTSEWLKETLPERARVGIDPVRSLSFSGHYID